MCTVGLTLAFVGYYNWRVTGNALSLPHAFYDSQYINYKVLRWEKLNPPLHYANRQFELYFNVWLRGPHKWGAQQFFVAFAQFFMGGILCVPLVVTLPWMLQDRRMRLPWIQLVFGVLGSLVVAVLFLPHHQAPLVATAYLLLVQALRHLRRWEIKGRPVGIFLTRLVVIVALTRIMFYVARPPSLVEAAGPERAKLVKQLEAMPTSHLVIVRYSHDHSPFSEWVYNAADVDHAKIVFAREIPGVDLKPLLHYFGGRAIWLLEPDRQPVQLRPYSPTPAESPGSAP